jgi:hypothetical protein
MAKAEQRSSSRSKIQPPEPSVPTLEVEYIPVTRRVKDQLAKESPGRNILGQLWQNIDRVAKLAGMVEAVHKVWPLIKPLL